MCPECEAVVQLPPDCETGQVVQCAECGAELEVITTDPPAFELAPAEEEDWGE
ncbi:MAG: lysine biosynthesis protein LysW [Candidatus Dormibacteria bacterium]